MTMLLKANTAVDVLIGPFVDDTDGNTAETGLTISQADIRLSKNGQNMAQKSDATAAAHDELGYYNCEFDATDTDTEGQLILCVHESGALPVWHEYNVLSEAAWDSLFAAKDVGFMDVNIKTVGRADAQETEANNLESACANYSATRGLTGTAVPAVAAAGAGGIPLSSAGSLEMDTLADWVNAGRLDAILDVIAADTTTDIPALIATAQSDLDTITGASGVVIQDGTIVAASLGADCITAAKIAPDAFEANMFATGAFTADAFAADALVAATFATGAFTADAFAADAIVAATLATDAITSDAFAASAAAKIYDETESETGVAYKLIQGRLYAHMQNEMNITDATGYVELRNAADSGEQANCTVTDDATTTTRTEMTWA